MAACGIYDQLKVLAFHSGFQQLFGNIGKRRKIEVALKTYPLLQQRLDLNLPINGPLLAGDGDYFKTIRTHVEQLNRICWEAGLDEAIRVPFAILEQSGPHILMLSNALDGKNPELTFSGNGRFPSEIEDGHRFGLANTFDLGGVVLAYFCEVDFDVRRDLDSWRFSREGLHK